MEKRNDHGALTPMMRKFIAENKKYLEEKCLKMLQFILVCYSMEARKTDVRNIRTPIKMSAQGRDGKKIKRRKIL